MLSQKIMQNQSCQKTMNINSGSPSLVRPTPADQWKQLWRTFRWLRMMLGERAALVLIEQKRRREALLLLEVIL